MQPRINIITLAVADLQRAIEFYRDGLGFPAESFRIAEDHAAVELLSGLSLVLYPRAEIAKLAGRELAAHRSTEVVLGYPAGSPAEVDEILARAKAAGAIIPAPPEEHPWGYAGYFVDLDGHVWELLGDPDFAEDGSAESEIIEVCHAWDRSMVTNDPDAIGAYMTDDWMIVGADGRIDDKRRFLDMVRSGVVSHDVMESHDMNVRVFGDSAVVVGRGISGGRYHGEPFHLVERVSSTFVRQSGGWRCASTHLSSLSDQQPSTWQEHK